MQVDASSARDIAASYREGSRQIASDRAAERAELRRDQRIEETREADRAGGAQRRERTPDPSRLVDVLA